LLNFGCLPGRARGNSLQGLAARNDVNEPLRAEVVVWIAALGSIPTVAPDAAPLPRAKALLREADYIPRFPKDRMVLVHYFAASSLLNRFVAKGAARKAEIGEAYYLLGVIESRVGRSIWISQTASCFEAAIRTAPGEAFAEEA